MLDTSPRLDKDTQGTVGSPSIVNAIKDKIDHCGIFVADVSIVDESKAGKKLVNQNVMFELGYAIARRSEMNIIMLFNADLGTPKDLPFDISHHRVLQFSLKQDDKKGTKLKQKLEDALITHLHALIEQEVSYIDHTLGAIQLLVMRVFSETAGDKRIVISRTILGWPTIYTVGSTNRTLLRELNSLDIQEVAANMDDLVGSGILTSSISDKGASYYSLTKQGYEMIRVLKNLNQD